MLSTGISTKIPKGRMLIIGGAEDKGDDDGPEIRFHNKAFQQYEILKELLPSEGSKLKRIEVITTASLQPKVVSRRYKQAFEKLEYDNVGFISIRSKDEAHDKKFIKRIHDAHAVLMSGGDQLRLGTILGNTEVATMMLEKYMSDKDFTIAGTSAGAMAMASIMIYHGESNEALLKGHLKVTSGLGFIDYCIIDTHFVKRGRFGRLAQAIITNPTCIGIGLGEDTALLITKGNHAECRGSGMVTIIDGKDAGHTNLLFAGESTPLCIENLKVHILCNGNEYLLRERQFLPGKDLLKKEKAAGMKQSHPASNT